MSSRRRWPDGRSCRGRHHACRSWHSGGTAAAAGFAVAAAAVGVDGLAGRYSARNWLVQYVTIFRSPVRLTYMVFVPREAKFAVAEIENIPLELTVPVYVNVWTLSAT